MFLYNMCAIQLRKINFWSSPVMKATMLPKSYVKPKNIMYLEAEGMGGAGWIQNQWESLGNIIALAPAVIYLSNIKRLRM